MIDALAAVQRRRLLLALTEHNPQDDDSVVVLGSGDETEAFERFVEMSHVHLPKLEEYGFVEWDRDNHEVSKGANFDQIRPLLELIADHEDELPDGWT